MKRVYLGDSRESLKTIAPESIDIIITSPPYKDSDGFTPDLMWRVFSECYRVLKPNSLCFMNFGHLAEEKLRPFKVCSLLESIGFGVNETITWVKNHYKPIQGKKRLNNLTEFIFLLHKGEMPELNRLAVGIPYKDKTNAKRFAGGRDLKCRGNVWYINYETIQKSKDKLHNDRFPIELPETCLKLSGLKGGVVLDPFGGSGTTGVAAQNLGFDFILMEQNEKHIITMQERINELEVISNR